ncbi:hypothetical protein [Acinetobacter guillouiae]|uniref:hypothetical protein n=1 Tax=Acinetobacter guillouiae TaxID=106649 RepID=UPI00125EF27D|nr:hypothetical protein [Acinetobacter guillouiae]
MVFNPTPNLVRMDDFYEPEDNRSIDPKRPPCGIDPKFLDAFNLENNSLHSYNIQAKNREVTKINENVHPLEGCIFFNDFLEAMKFSKLNTPSKLRRVGDSWVVELT